MSNMVTLIGRVTKDFQMCRSAKGTPYVKLSVAVDGEDGNTVWYNVAIFKTLAQHFYNHTHGAKGTEFKFKGKLTKREYARRDGGVGVSNDVVAEVLWLEGGTQLDKFTPIHDDKPDAAAEA